MMHLPLKHSAADLTIFTRMSTLAATHQAVNLSQGFPDFPIDERLTELLYQASKDGYNQYAPMTGLPQLREAIADDIAHRFKMPTNATHQITITPGATYGLYVALSCCLSQGDEVIILEPAYDSYLPAIEMNGGRAVPVSLRETDFSIDWESVKNAITSYTKVILINTPNNPAGVLWSAADRDTLAQLAEQHGLIVISDEVYEQMIFDEAEHVSVWQNESLRERSFVIFSFGKVYQQTGWKLGYVLAGEKLMAAFRKVHQYLCFSVNTPAQMALAHYLALPDKPDIRRLIQDRRDYFLQSMKDTPFTFSSPASGSYFQVMSYAGISEMDDLTFAEWLTKEIGVATIPLSAFYHDKKDQKLLRFCFSKKEETLAAAVGRLSRI